MNRVIENSATASVLSTPVKPPLWRGRELQELFQKELPSTHKIKKISSPALLKTNSKSAPSERTNVLDDGNSSTETPEQVKTRPETTHLEFLSTTVNYLRANWALEHHLFVKNFLEYTPARWSKTDKLNTESSLLAYLLKRSSRLFLNSEKRKAIWKKRKEIRKKLKASEDLSRSIEDKKDAYLVEMEQIKFWIPQLHRARANS